MAEAIDKGERIPRGHGLASARSDADDEFSEQDSTGLEGPGALMRSSRSVAELVLHAANLPHLRFFDCAFYQANRSSYRSKRRLATTFETLNRYGAILSINGKLGENPLDWFAQSRIDYAPHESEETMRRFGRDFYDNKTGISISMQEHLRLGAGGNRDEQDIFRIHFKWDLFEKVVLIGHVGRHLPVATS